MFTLLICTLMKIFIKKFCVHDTSFFRFFAAPHLVSGMNFLKNFANLLMFIIMSLSLSLSSISDQFIIITTTTFTMHHSILVPLQTLFHKSFPS